MPKTSARVNPEVITWARERAQMTTAALAKRSGLPKEEKIIAWEDGTALPTFKQAQTFAKATHIPFGYLFLPHPPEETLPIPDLRTVGSQPLGRPSAELLEVIRIALFRQSWYQDYVKAHYDEINPVVGRLDINTPVQAIVDDMRSLLGTDTQPPTGTWEEYARDLIKRIEAQGILVMRSGIVGNNTHRPLSVSEFRGFAISDKSAPLIFINAADAPEARLFTLIHELAHIWTGISGVSDAKPSNHRKEEKVSNAVAAEFLVPSEVFTRLWRKDTDAWEDNLAPLSAQFHVSKWVIARKALDSDFISQAQYVKYTNDILKRYKNKEGGGGNFYAGLKGKVSERFSTAVLTEALSGRTLYRDAGKLLGLKPAKIPTYAKELGF